MSEDDFIRTYVHLYYGCCLLFGRGKEIHRFLHFRIIFKSVFLNKQSKVLQKNIITQVYYF